MNKNCLQGFFKISTSYGYSNNCSPFHQFYSDLKILQNGPFFIKRIVSGKNFKATSSVVYPIGMT